MATLSITIPDAHATRAMDAIAANQGFTGTFNGQPETKAQFARRWMAEQVKSQLKMHESAAAAQNAKDQSDSGIEGIGIS